MLGELLRRDRDKRGLSLEEAARLLQITAVRLRKLEADEAWPDWETYDLICKLFGWAADVREATESRT
jgi:transcriptional regulator with XRE-family HTH domain